MTEHSDEVARVLRILREPLLETKERPMTNSNDAKLHPLVKAVCIVVLVFAGLWVAGSILQGILIAQALS